ncbi:MAG: rhodanese-related sulfurtransferase [Planctomycetaceae bacterium]|nr:rhodanese-related sulfurtransferase [Planctomycetaceae bacterium]MBT6056060.1 rhodanese-related sulfurtransferase [Planctomycetaceae bacterium]MBT6643685.1 rhodanese-related sulfurtransferase [Planctomycetaceae bacterium]MBT6920689.1 rhodanese-related sulfurtransferase [Planctomycetaceae bacterium]MBT7729509.1 rhodanese-related sulfurtransferase [Planctomycetaceae bacterium]
MDRLLVVAFYKFVRLNDLTSLQYEIESWCRSNDVFGIVLLASEGINSTIAGPREGVLRVLEMIRQDARFSDMRWKESFAEEQPFHKLRVRLKKEIVTMGVSDIDPNELVGTYVKPADWNALISDPDVIVIDARNHYETEIGTFKGALEPGLDSFRELPSWLEKNIDVDGEPRVAMFCTGGIRCEKSTAFLKQAGVKEVYHLEGGILKYLEEVPQDESLWEGECFVFDQRVAVGHGLDLADYELCRACRFPLSASDKQSEFFQEGVSCLRCYDQTSREQKTRFAERQKQFELAQSRGESFKQAAKPARG